LNLVIYYKRILTPRFNFKKNKLDGGDGKRFSIAEMTVEDDIRSQERWFSSKIILSHP
jgi:hypothetical protein